jgi:hypothetical protein
MFDNKNFKVKCRSARSPFDLLMRMQSAKWPGRPARESRAGMRVPQTIGGTQMKYMLLIYHDEQAWNGLTESERQDIYREYRQLIQQLQSNGQYLVGDQLQPTTTARTVRVRDAKQLVTDGPFAETREQLGGFFMIEAKDLNEAQRIAAQIPSARTGSIEVRPVVESAEPATA